MVAVWDWLMEDNKEFHQTFFERDFDYEALRGRKTPSVIVNSTTDPWIDFETSKKLAVKLDEKFIAIDNTGHFTTND